MQAEEYSTESSSDEKKKKKLKPKSLQYPFTLDVALSRLPVRLLVRNYGIPPEFRESVTAQLVSKKSPLVMGNVVTCNVQRALLYAVKYYRFSMDSLLRDSNKDVRGGLNTLCRCLCTCCFVTNI